MVKTHESMFGLIVYGLLLQYSCLDFDSVIGVFSFMSALLLLGYLIFLAINLYQKINGEK
jgi:hypothetical protein